ncbi:MFS transporter [Sesbania bispinosa]|nr:MFS transporter [Sesbania bispinosa]
MRAKQNVVNQCHDVDHLHRTRRWDGRFFGAAAELADEEGVSHGFMDLLWFLEQ